MEELIENISSIISKLYLSVENKGYDILMKISDISENLFSQNPLNIIYNDTYRIYIDLFIKVVIFSFFIFYFLKLSIVLRNFVWIFIYFFRHLTFNRIKLIPCTIE